MYYRNMMTGFEISEDLSLCNFVQIKGTSRHGYSFIFYNKNDFSLYFGWEISHITLPDFIKNSGMVYWVMVEIDSLLADQLMTFQIMPMSIQPFARKIVYTCEENGFFISKLMPEIPFSDVIGYTDREIIEDIVNLWREPHRFRMD